MKACASIYKASPEKGNSSSGFQVCEIYRLAINDGATRDKKCKYEKQTNKKN